MLKSRSSSAPVEVNSTGLVRHEQKLVPPKISLKAVCVEDQSLKIGGYVWVGRCELKTGCIQELFLFMI